MKRSVFGSFTLGLLLILSLGASAQPVRVFGPPEKGKARPPLWINLRNNSTTSTAPPYTPAQVRHAYGFDQITGDGTGQTIAIVDAYDDSSYVQSDLNTFCAQFGIPTTTVQVIYAQGIKPSQNSGWQQEISLDVQWAHAIAPGAKILLIEAYNNSTSYLMQAVDVAVANHATVVSMSWGGGESSSETGSDSHFTAAGVTFVASAGDSGEAVEYPAASPGVVAVGGTSLYLDASGNYASESAWSGSGGGISAYEALPSWQTGWSPYLTGLRGVPDVAYLADPNTGVYVVYQGGWYQFGGTSVGAPQWAGLIALANQARGANGSLSGASPALYSVANGGQANGFYVINANNLHDITSGSNDTNPDDFAVAGYDLVTGLGSPAAGGLVPALGSWNVAPPSPDFSLAISPASATLPPAGGTVSYTVTMTPLNGFSDTVNLTLGALPSGVTAALTASSLTTISPSTTLTVTVATGTAAGSYTVTVTGTAATTPPTHTASATVVVASTMTVKSITYSTSGRNQSNLNITVTVVNGSGSGVPNASVAITLNLNGSAYASGTATTGSNGQVTFQLRNAPHGTYNTIVNSVTATGYVWDGNYPANSFKK